MVDKGDVPDDDEINFDDAMNQIDDDTYFNLAREVSALRICSMQVGEEGLTADDLAVTLEGSPEGTDEGVAQQTQRTDTRSTLRLI